MANCFSFDPSKRDEKGTLSPRGLHGLPSWTLWPMNPHRDIPLTHTHETGFQSVWQSFYLMVASKTWTVESLSKETVLITNLTAFWNSDEFPIIFKKRNTSHYEMTLRLHDRRSWATSSEYVYVLWFCHSWERNTKKTRYLLEYILGQMASPFPPNWRTVSADGKTLTITPHKIISSRHHPSSSSLSFTLII